MHWRHLANTMDRFVQQQQQQNNLLAVSCCTKSTGTLLHFNHTEPQTENQQNKTHQKQNHINNNFNRQ